MAWAAMKERWRNGVGCLCPVLPSSKDSLGHLHATVGASTDVGSNPQTPEGSLGCTGFLQTWGRAAGRGGLPPFTPGPTLPARFGATALLPETHRGGGAPCAAGSDTTRGVLAPCPHPVQLPHPVPLCLIR